MLTIGGLVFAAWLMVVWCVFISWCLDGADLVDPHEAEAERLADYKDAIDQLYDDAEHEVQRIIESRQLR